MKTLGLSLFQAAFFSAGKDEGADLFVLLQGFEADFQNFLP